MALNQSIKATLFARHFQDHTPKFAPPPVDPPEFPVIAAPPDENAEMMMKQGRRPIDGFGGIVLPTPTTAPTTPPYFPPQSQPPPYVPPDYSDLRIADPSAETPQQSPLDIAQAKLAADAAAPAQKQPAWKQGLFLALQAADRFFNPQNSVPIEMLGNAKKRMRLEKDQRELAPLIQLEQRRQAEESAKMKRRIDEAGLKKTQAETKFIEVRPQIEADKVKSRFEQEAQKQLNRLQVITEKERLNNTRFDKIVSQNGKFYKLFKDGKRESLVNDATGEQERDLLSEPIETTSENGTKGFAKFGAILTADATKNYRDSILGLQEKNYQERVRSNKVREKLAADKFAQAAKEFDTQIGLREQARKDALDARAKGDERAAQAAEDRAKNSEATLIKMRAATVGNTNLDDDQEAELLDRIDKLGIK